MQAGSQVKAEGFTSLCVNASLVSMGGAKGRQGAAALSCLSPCHPPAGCPSGEILMMTKCFLVSIHMPKYDLLNVIYAKQHRYLWYFFVFSYIKNRQSCSFHWTFKSQVFQLQGAFAPDPLTRGYAPRPRYIFWCTQQLNNVNIWPTHNKVLCPLCPGSFPHCLLKFRFLVPPMLVSVV